MLNKCILMGRITKDLEIRQAGETKVLKFNLAVNRMKKDEADFISCVSFGKTAEFITQYMSKGSQIAIEGRIQTGSYDKDGTKVYTTDVVIEKCYFADSKKSIENLSDKEDLAYIGIDAHDDILPF